MQPEPAVLVVDDEEAALRTAERTLRAGGIENVICVQNSTEAMPTLSRSRVGAVLLDLAMPVMSGEELLPIMLERHPDIPVIIITGYNEVEVAVRCLRAGAFDYLVKPVETSRMVSGVKRALEIRELRDENVLLRERMFSMGLDHPEVFADFASVSPTMNAIFQYIETISRTSKPVLITGETGTGKELVAKAIHLLSGKQGEFVAVNVAGLDDPVFSDSLFGHTRGSFTGAHEVRRGLIERAADGTLFLDEIGDLTPASQVKLLRLLQEREYFPVGSDLPKRTNARIVLATNRDLHAMQDSGEFRRDLYYRLTTHHVDVPPLRNRLEDLPGLVDSLLQRASDALGKKKPTPPRELLDLLGTYHFPGNVRELDALVFDAVSKHRSKVLSLDVFKAHILRGGNGREHQSVRPVDGITFPVRFPTLQEARRIQVEEAMRRANGNQAVAAEMLGITRTALNKWIHRKGMS